MPTNPANARILLKQGKAKVIQRTPFTIQLLYETTEHIQPVTVGIDDGGIHVGIAAVSHGQSLFQQEVVLRSDIKSKLDTRRQYRRSRRHRKTRYRKPRFLNRKQFIPTCKVCGKNAPSSKVFCRVCLKKATSMMLLSLQINRPILWTGRYKQNMCSRVKEACMKQLQGKEKKPVIGRKGGITRTYLH